MTDIYTYRMQTKQLANCLNGNYHLVANLAGCSFDDVANVLSMQYMNAHIYNCACEIANQIQNKTA